MRDSDQLLERALAQRCYVWVHGPDFTFMGFIVDLSESLVLIHRFLDFADNGFAIVRRSVIEAVDVGSRSLKFFEMMMRGEGVIGSLEAEFAIPMDSLASALRAIQSQRFLVLLDRGAHEDPDSEFNVGELLTVDDLHTRIRFVTSWGEWQNDSVVEMPHIVRTEFGTPYLRALQKYAGSNSAPG